MGIEFHQTGYGRKFFDSDLPRLINALEKIAKVLEERAELFQPLIIEENLDENAVKRIAGAFKRKEEDKCQEKG